VSTVEITPQGSTAPAREQGAATNPAGGPAHARTRTRVGRFGGWSERPINLLARAIVLRVLAHLKGGELELLEEMEDGGTPMRFGDVLEGHELRVALLVRSPRFYRYMLKGSLGLSEAYMQGLWDCDDLVSLTRIAALNVGFLDSLRRRLAPVLIPVQRWLRFLARNTPVRSRRRIEAHYDLGNELFSLFLDPTMMYSCAVFEPPQATLEQASLAKLERVCTKLDLSPDDHVLEIGTGWGGFAMYAARNYGCRVTTTTISREQHAYASERIKEAGLEHRITVLLEDYRDLTGTYDKLVSIEMIEAVGWRYFPTFFRRCSELLAADGAMLLQAITIDDRAYEVEKGGKSFINTHIFPGGCLPSMEVISRSVARVTDLRQVHLEDITAHYATTLERWRERFSQAGERVEELGYDERFRRMWDLYLSYCEGGFRERRIQDVQLLLAKPLNRGEPLGTIAER
jgi:cyclopropane-fatty-acyl-phospholipid synthase